MSDIKLWFTPGACSLAPHILLKEIGADFDIIQMKFDPSANAFPEKFRAINPKMKVPVFSLNGNIITEAPAILTLIASLAPDMHLTGRTALETARVYEWMNWLSGTVHGQGFGSIWRSQKFSDDPNSHDGIKVKGKETASGCFDDIEQKLNGFYSVGDAYTMVDPYLFVFYRWGKIIGLDMKGKYPKYTAFVANLSQRPAVKAALEAEKLDASHWE